MKKFFYVLLVGVLFCNLSFAQKAKIVTEAVTPHMLTESVVTTNSVSTGLDVVPNGTYVYLSPLNVGNNEPITGSVFTLETKPTGSAAVLETVNGNWAQFQVDVVGVYTVKLSLTTASGTHDTTKTIYSANYRGVGNFAGVAQGEATPCMGCHEGDEVFDAIYTKWSASGHANVFSREVEISDHYSESCMKCHTTGYDHNIAANNGGFDDVASTLGWSYVAPGNDKKFDSLVSDFPDLVNLATIGCEMCHGPGSTHNGSTAGRKKIQISLADGTCAQCHDEPWRHNKVAEYENSKHSEALWSTSFKRNATNNSLSNCGRCHEAKGYVAFSKDQVFNTVDFVQADFNGITCATCHDPHSGELREMPAGSDTLANGFSYTGIGGKGETCFNCHKARVNGTIINESTVINNAHWGPHHSTQTDVLLGKNAASFGTSFASSSAHYSGTEDACVTCHMDTENIPGQSDPNRNFVAGHTFRLHNPENGYDHTVGCSSCHGSKTTFEEFEGDDYDFDGTIEGVQDEIDGLLTKLRIQLPPAGQDTIDWAQITTGDQKKAYWNYMLIAYDGSRGIHNTKFAVDVLTKSFIAVGGIIPVELISFDAKVNGNSVNLSWQTASEKNNMGFEVQRKVDLTWEKVGFVAGNGTVSSVSQYSFEDQLPMTSKKVYYRLKQIDLDGTFEYSKEVEVASMGPSKYALSQNYPNPFNPTTVIKYALPFESNVKVTIYNIAGESVMELVNSVQAANEYEVEFNTSKAGVNLSSGIYFYSIEANSVDGSQSFRQTKKMILMK